MFAMWVLHPTAHTHPRTRDRVGRVGYEGDMLAAVGGLGLPGLLLGLDARLLVDGIVALLLARLDRGHQEAALAAAVEGLAVQR
eukprot:9391616-Pyramimonas_sp.AAC.1